MAHHSNPFVSQQTRRWLFEVAKSGDPCVDEPSLPLLHCALRKCIHEHPGGMIYALAQALGAEEHRAIIASTAVELFYCAASLTDDLQDGETEGYFGAHPLPLRLNTQAHLIGLAGHRAGQLEDAKVRGLVAALFHTCATMLVGQRMELTRSPWNPGVYEQVARLSAGAQFAAYVKLALGAARKEDETLVDLGYSIGTLVQIIEDWQTGDSRWVCFDKIEQIRIWRSTIKEVTDGSAHPIGGELARGFLRACPKEFTS